MKKNKKKKVFVAMSGGVDSSVAAALLKRAGFDVRGVFMRLTDLPNFKESQKMAEKIAKILGIPFYVFDLRKEFKKEVINDFLESYKRGITPNPCVICNKKMKFGLFLERALKFGADFVATGHYARVKKGNSGLVKLLRARDKKRDQSYFLWMLNQNQLKRILFPIGNFTRAGVENLAKKFKLPVLKAKKSVEICFIQKTINDFLKKYLKEKPGKIVDTKGKILGEHQGLWFYTIGQRKGISLSGGPAFAKASAGKPSYALGKDLKRNLLIVTQNEKDLYKKELIAKNVNWILKREPKLPLEVEAKIRYRQNLAKAKIRKKLKEKTYLIEFKSPQKAITPGQSVVFYKGEELLGGGIIT